MSPLNSTKPSTSSIRGSKRRLAPFPPGSLSRTWSYSRPTESRAYTANVGAGTVSVVDVAGRKLIKVIPVAETVQRISITPDGKYVFTADQKTPRLAVIDTSTNAVSRWITLPAVGYGTAPTPDGKWLLVTLQSANQIAVVDLAQMKVERTIAVGKDPVQILVRRDRPVAYISCSGDGNVAVLNLDNWKVEKMIATGPGSRRLGLGGAKAVKVRRQSSDFGRQTKSQTARLTTDDGRLTTALRNLRRHQKPRRFPDLGRLLEAISNLSNTGSLHARPKNDTPTGIPSMNPAGTVMSGYPATAAAFELPPPA